MRPIDGNELSNNIKAERHRAGLTVEDVTKKLKISRPTYLKYENDASKISIARLMDLAEIFGCNISMFFYTKEDDK